MADAPEFSLLVKPVSFDCNLRCDYCFYLKKEEFFGCGKHLMSRQTLEKMISGFLRTPQPLHAFGWQGGEPTTAGLDFFREAVRLMEQYGRGGVRVSNALQTNGTLLDDEWAAFLKQYHFLVGVSLDGPAMLHDLHRKDAAGQGSHGRVLRGIDALRRHGVQYNILTLVNRDAAQQPLTVYRYLRDEMQTQFHQYIECVETAPDGSLQPYALTPELWGEFLCRIFDEWYQYDLQRVSVRLFDAVLNKLVLGTPNSCAMSRCCNHYLVIEHDGSIYPCELFVQPEYRLGKVGDRALEKFLILPEMRAFSREKAAVPPECAACRYYRFCAGDCTKNRRSGRSLLCAGWKMFYEHALPRFEEIARRIPR
ncbi:MAG: anaerobic sulfatase maturase [Lentisphaeria bacterium]|nr:anaerobic sulfatase maturase [Lentisphaeria bacterium]